LFYEEGISFSSPSLEKQPIKMASIQREKVGGGEKATAARVMSIEKLYRE